MDLFRYFREDYQGHSKSSAYLLALLSYYVYGGVPGNGTFEIRLRNFFQNLSDGDPLKVEAFTQAAAFPYDTQAVVLANSRIVIVVFRGTEGLTAFRDWITNARHLMRKAPDSWGNNLNIHKGFYNALSSVYQSVRNQVLAFRDNQQKVFLTGHSLGGALATVCAYRFQKVGGINVSGVYVFGSPRVGDLSFANQYNSLLKDKTFRWVKNMDFASTLPDYAPPPLPSTRYFHVGLLNFIKANGAIDMDAVDFEPVGVPSVPDHSMPDYCRVMYNRLSSDPRVSASNPDYLVKGDVPAGGLNF